MPTGNQLSISLLHHKCNRGATIMFAFRHFDTGVVLCDCTARFIFFISSINMDSYKNGKIFIDVAKNDVNVDQNFRSHDRPCRL